MLLFDWLIIAIYFLILAAIIVYARRARSMSDFAVGSRAMPAGIVFATLSATLIGPGYSMGIANNASTGGLVWVLIFLGFSVQMILVGLFIAPKFRQFEKAFTIGDVMGYRYGKLVKLITGVISVVLLAGFVGVIARASGDILFAITGIDFVWAIVLSTVIVIVYSTFGGIKSVIITDIIQFIVLALSIPVTILFLSDGFAVHEMVAQVPNELLNVTDAFPFWVFAGLFLSFFLGEMLLPPYATRVLVSKSSKDAKRGFVLTGAFSAVWFFLCAVVGIFGIAMFPETENAFVAVIKESLPIGLTGIAVAALFSIIMSSQSSVLNSAAVSFNYDILSVFSRDFRSDQKALRSGRWLNVLIGLFAVIFAIRVPGVVEALLICYTLWAPTIILPFVIGVLYKDVKPIAGLSSIIAGGAATAIWEWVFLLPYDVPSLAIGVLANQIVFWGVQFTLTNPDHIEWFKKIKE